MKITPWRDIKHKATAEEVALTRRAAGAEAKRLCDHTLLRTARSMSLQNIKRLKPHERPRLLAAFLYLQLELNSSWLSRSAC